MASRAPSGSIGAFGGVLGALPLVSAARSLATRLAPPPRLPGAERLAADLKSATFAEAGVFLLVLPLFALAFGALLPRWLERRGSGDGVSPEWTGAAFAIALPLWRSGVPARWSVCAGAIAALGLAIVLLRTRRRPGHRDRPHAEGAETWMRLVAAAAAWEIARRGSARGHDPDFAPLCIVAFLAALPFFARTFFHGARSRA
ncbi:MAG TPA: hypothetical protein VIY96_09300 [Thermoanaerobaculia bacterium]